MRPIQRRVLGTVKRQTEQDTQRDLANNQGRKKRGQEREKKSMMKMRKKRMEDNKKGFF